MIPTSPRDATLRLRRLPDRLAIARPIDVAERFRDLPGLDRIPWKGEIGKRVYENVSKDAWKMWLEHSKMVMNEYRLNPLDPSSQKIMEEQMEQFFFGEGAKLPEGYVPNGKDPQLSIPRDGHQVAYKTVLIVAPAGMLEAPPGKSVDSMLAIKDMAPDPRQPKIAGK